MSDKDARDAVSIEVCKCGHPYGQHWGYGKVSPCRAPDCKCREFAFKNREIRA